MSCVSIMCVCLYELWQTEEAVGLHGNKREHELL